MKANHGTKMKFHIIMEKDEDGRHVAERIDLPDCLSEGGNWNRP